MKTTIPFLAASLLAVSLLPVSAFAGDYAHDHGFYVAGQAGLNMPTRDDDTLDNAAVFGGAFGYQAYPNTRIEMEASYRKNDVDGGGVIFGDTKIASGLINAYYDFKNRTPVTPYLGAGAGWAYGKGTVDVPALGLSADESDNAFAWQGIAGVSFDVAPRLAITTDYRYFDTANFDDIGDDYSAHEVRAGVRYSF